MNKANVRTALTAAALIVGLVVLIAPITVAASDLLAAAIIGLAVALLIA